MTIDQATSLLLRCYCPNGPEARSPLNIAILL